MRACMCLPQCRRRWWLSTRAAGDTTREHARSAGFAGLNWRVLLRPRVAMNTHARMHALAQVLTVLMVYMIWWHLVPEIQRFHDLVPADCLIAGAPVLVK
jgi:hypothetical protein